MRVYGNDSFCLVLEQKLDLRLCTPADDLLLEVKAALLGRRVGAATIAGLSALGPRPFPAFVKSLIPKQIRFRILVELGFDTGAPPM